MWAQKVNQVSYKTIQYLQLRANISTVCKKERSKYETATIGIDVEDDEIPHYLTAYPRTKTCRSWMSRLRFPIRVVRQMKSIMFRKTNFPNYDNSHALGYYTNRDYTIYNLFLY